MSPTTQTARLIFDKAAAARRCSRGDGGWHTEVDHDGHRYLLVVNPDQQVAYIAAELLHIHADEPHTRSLLAVAESTPAVEATAGPRRPPADSHDRPVVGEPPPRAWCARSYHADLYQRYAFVFRVVETNTRFTVYTPAAHRYTVGRTYLLTLTPETTPPGAHHG